MRNWVLSLVFLSLTWMCLDSGAQISKPNFQDPSGRWVGLYTAGHRRVFVVIRMKKENGKWVGTYNRPVLDWENDLDLRALTIHGNTINFELGESSSAIHVDTRWIANSLQGKVSSAGTRGKIILEPTATLSKDYMDTLAGDYETAAGDSYVIERENNYLCFLNRRTGRSGRLMPASETEFWSGPSLDIWYPQEFRFEFGRVGDGQPTQLKVSERGKQKIVADRKELYRKEEVAFRNAETKLSGTLRVPPGSQRRPAVVVLHGSNYQTRGGQYGSLAFVADQFARNGFVALSYDKRGTGKSGGKRDDDPELISGDAASAVRMLRGRPEVDPDRVGLWGISQGGIIEPLVAQKVDRLAFFINVSGAVVNTNEQEIQRTELELRADGFTQDDVEAAVHLQRVKFRYACKRDNWEEYEKVLKEAQGKAWLPDPYIGPPDSKDSTAWNFWQCGVEPGKYWESVHVPVLYIQGEFEANSSPRENLLRLEQAMKVAGNTRFEHKLIPGAEHSMFRAKNGGEKESPFLNTYVDGYFWLWTDWAKQKVAVKRQ
jgi:alpha-beta hydrolase superfamily lysophospholipase